VTDPTPGIFTTLRVLRGRVWFWPAHVARLEDGARFLGLSPPPPAGALLAAVSEAVAGLDDARVRVTLPPAGGHRVEAGPYAPPAAPWRLRMVEASPAVDRVHHKTTDRREYERARSRAGGVDDALLAWRGDCILETSIANVFFVEEGALVTPPASEPLLPGIARAHLIAGARTLGIDVREENIDSARAATADGCLVTNALFVVHPVVAIEDLATYEVPAMVRILSRELSPPRGAVRIIQTS
jgi:branched-subunit amino acid aminotransferase/4-amino-4-deoxychorismate lyase